MKNRGPIAPILLLLAVGLVALWLEFSSRPTPGPNTNQQPAQNSETDINPRTPEERVADYTLWLERFTGLLVIVAAAQIVLLFRTDRTAREGIEIAGQQTAIQGSQADIAIKQKEIARLQYLAAHRPKLVVRGIALTSFEAGKPMRAVLTIANSGGSEGVITAGNVTLAIAEDGRLPDIPNYDEDRLFALNPRFPRGRKNTFVKFEDGPLSQSDFDCINKQDSTPGRMTLMGTDPIAALYMFGFIRYEDGAGQSYELGFCRRFNTNGRRFHRFEDPNYDYED